MQKVALTIGFAAWAAVSFGTEKGRASLAVRLCFTDLPVVAAVTEPKGFAQKYRVASVPIADLPFGNSRPADYASRHHAPETPRDEGYTPLRFTVADYERRLRAFAADEVDERSLTYVSPLADGTRIKMHLVTGELLIVTRGGQVSHYAKLPVGQRSIAALKKTSQVFELLAGTQTTKTRWPEEPKTFAKLTGGEALPHTGFTNYSALANHVDKHVLVLPAARGYYSVREKANHVRSRRTELAIEFGDIRRPFLAAVAACDQDETCERAAYDTMCRAYEDRVKQFMVSRKPSILTFSQMETYTQDGFESSQVTGYRFDVLTNEMAVFNRLNGHLLTFFQMDLKTGNQWLASHGYGEANTPFEYFLALVSCHRSYPSRQLAAQICHPVPVLAGN